MFKYNRHEPKKTLLYKIIEEHYPAFASHLAEEGRVLPPNRFRAHSKKVGNFMKFLLMRRGQTV